jgi:hypothetical protein
LLNTILVLTNCQVVVVIFLELVAAVGLIELLETRIELLRRLPRWLWLVELLHCDWIWL